MKKFFLFVSLTVLFMTGCAKENFSKLTGKDGVVSFTVALPETGTRAVTHQDGNAACINHWIMEVIDEDGDVYNRQEDDAEVGVKTHTFNVALVKSQTYTVLFWADTKDAYNTVSLRDVKLVDESGYTANLDSRDAFSAVVTNFQSTAATSANEVTLKRPFGQMNVVFTDLKKLYETMGSKDAEYKKYEPKNFIVTAKIPTSFNVMTQTAGEPAAVELVNTAEFNYLNNYAAHTGSDILYMDYIFATAESKDIVDVDFEFYSKDKKIAHKFTSIPFQRNYRTNILGDFMTSNAKWNVVVDPIWETEEIPYEVVNDIAGANNAIAKAIAQGKNEFNIKFGSEPDDAGVPGQENGGATKADISVANGLVGKAILTSVLPSGSTLNIMVECQTKALYIGDYSSDTTTTIATSGLNPATVTVNVPSGSSIQTLVVNAPSKSVYINGVKAASTGTITNLDAITSDNTLVVEANQSVSNLKIRQGALKIHGSVADVVIPEGHGDIYVRDCEGLSQSVYTVLEPYIDTDKGYLGEKESGKSTYRIYQGLTQVAKIGDKIYYSLQKAFDEVANGQTIELLSDFTQTTGVLFNKDVAATFDLKNKTFKVTDDTQNNHRAIKVANGTLTVKNGVVDARNVNAQGEPTAIIADNFDGIYGAFRAEDGTTLNLKNLTVYNNHFFGLSCKYLTGAAGEVDSCTFYSNYGGSVEAAGGVVTVKNSAVHQEGVSTNKEYDYIACGIGTSANGTANVTDCQIEAYFPLVEMPSGGIINVNGGTYATNAQNGSVAFLCETYKEEDHNYLNISSGNFSGKLTTHYVDAFANYHISISGGTYTVNPSNYVIDGYKAVANGTDPETWTVKATTPANANTTGFGDWK